MLENPPTRQAVAIDLEMLLQEGVIERVGLTRYRLRGGKAASSLPVEDLKASDVESLLRMLAKERWKPRILAKLPTLPIIISKLYRIALRQANGEVIPEGALKQMRTALTELLDSLTNMHSLVNSLVQHEELWNTESVGAFLLETETKQDTLKELTDQLEKWNLRKYNEDGN